MTTKLLSKLFWMFAFFCFLLIVQLADDDNGETTINQSKQAFEKYSNLNQLKNNYPEFYVAFKKASQEEDENKKLAAIEYALTMAAAKKIDEKEILQQLNLSAARIYRSRWHVVYALEKYYAAQAHVFKNNIAEEIKSLESYRDKSESERLLHNDYIAYKYSGPAKTFTGKILVAYIFVDDGIKTRWSNKTKQQTLQSLALVQQWQQQKASDYAVSNIEFINKAFVAKRNPSLIAPKNVSFKSTTAEINQFADSIVQTLGAKNVGDFIKKQIEIAGADQGVIYFHSNLEQRSFARLCGYTHKKLVYIDGVYKPTLISKCNDEFVMLTEKVKRNRWDKMHYTQAHEMMHVFGAADLYNIKNAANYALTDLMNSRSKNLEYTSIEPITAYAVGWQSKPPQTPFTVLER